MTEPQALHAWLTALRDTGLTLLTGVPAAEREVERIARRISLPRDSNFGAVFDVMTMANANSNAYTAIELPPHVDLPTREYQPGFQFFHCLDNQAQGGESTYVDGFAVAEHLRADGARDLPPARRDAARLPLLSTRSRTTPGTPPPWSSTSTARCARSASSPG